ncbi:MAG: hypothetical protein BWY71_00989 [Planctomycetes bacterium ADurb.Bin412]|nr:MAG: hypothetical protein BWY71_00989 [Planctomycetes bacterium ADurb.Bin412]
MAENDGKVVQKTKNKPIRLFLTIIGFACILQYFVVGIVNVIRGYSIGTYLPFIILMVGSIVFLCLGIKYPKKHSIYSVTVSFALIYYSLISISQGQYSKKAEGYYKAGQYQQALQAYEKEAHAWYHLLSYNYHERAAMYKIAEAYCQLEDFDKARNTYELVIERYQGEFYAGQAQKRLAELKTGLEIVAYYPDHIADTPKKDSIQELEVHLPPEYIKATALYDIALAYQYNLNCYAKAVEVYTIILGMDVSEETKKLAKEQIIQLKRS